MPKYLSPHFTVEELACRCGCGLIPHDEFIDKLESIRYIVGFKFIITSGARCSKYNARVAATGDFGPHVPDPHTPQYGAVDMLASGIDVMNMLRTGPDYGWWGFGLKQHGPHGTRWIHADNWPPGRFPRPAIWTYNEE